MTVAEARNPVLAAWVPISVTTDSIWPATMSAGISWKPVTPSEFCTVTAVTAASACTPSRARVRVSACNPAPPPESDPAMVNTRAGEWPGAVNGRKSMARSAVSRGR